MESVFTPPREKDSGLKNHVTLVHDYDLQQRLTDMSVYLPHPKKMIGFYVFCCFCDKPGISRLIFPVTKTFLTGIQHKEVVCKTVLCLCTTPNLNI